MSSTLAVSRALAAPPGVRGSALLQIPEDQWFERKSARIRAPGLVKALIGFANADGGTIVIGLSEGEVEGTDRVSERLRSDWRQAPRDCVPPIRVTFKEVRCQDAGGDDVTLTIVEVEPGESVHMNAADDVFLRVGDETRRLTYDQRRELEFDKGQASYEATVVPDATREELDEGLLTAYAQALDHPDAWRLLQARGLVDRTDRITIGCLLLFGTAPQSRFPETLVRVCRYRGSARGSGAGQELLSDVRCEGPIPRILEAAQREVSRVVPTRQALGIDGLFGPVALVPRDAWLEGLVNAVVHRSYSLAGDHIRIEVFDDRIEISSPGRFPGLVDVSDPNDVTRFARNPRIARVCADLRFGQELGEGIRRIFEEMRLAGLAQPEYFQTSGSVQLTLLSTPVDQELESRLPPRGRKLVQLIRETERASTGDLVNATRLSRPVIAKDLRQLEALGVIERVGKSPNDPRAYWRLR